MLTSDDIEAYADIWMAMKPYINARDREEACEKFMSIIDESVSDVHEDHDNWLGLDDTIDKVIRNNYLDDIDKTMVIGINGLVW